MNEKLIGIDAKLIEVVRLEERMNALDQTLAIQSSKLDSHGKRLYDVELWQASQGDKNSVLRLITNVQDEIKEFNDRIQGLESSKDVWRGQKDVGKEFLKIAITITVAIVIYRLTKG